MDSVFEGSGYDRTHYEKLALTVDLAHRQDQAGLYRNRWFDYHRMYLSEATYYFAHLYKKFTHKFNATYLDIRTATDERAFVPNDIFKSRDLTAMWRARATADLYGLPYEFVLDFASHRCFDRTFHHFPRPNQLYGQEFEIDLIAAWKDQLSRKLCYSTHSDYKAVNISSKGFGKRHLEFVVNQILARPVAARANLLARMFNEGVLNPGIVVDAFPEETLNTAIAIALRLENQSALTAL